MTAEHADGEAVSQPETRVEAVLFATDSPLTPEKIARVADLPGRKAVRQAIDTLNARYDEHGASFRIEEIAGGYQMLTRPEYHGLLERLFQSRSQTRLSQAAMETLAIVAYRQPILRADIEVIRGVSCGEVLRGLLEKQLVKIVGRADVLGRPMLYGTTRRFLEVFGLASLDDLPRAEELRIPAERSKPAPPASDADAAPPPDETDTGATSDQDGNDPHEQDHGPDAANEPKPSDATAGDTPQDAPRCEP
ncbi:MAG: SMC-Scp complex subunit ScpB [Phycisphaerae bacterium]|nr:SMC-Scp complex subunit ScpB [Phycisphaerae bacterium]